MTNKQDQNHRSGNDADKNQKNHTDITRGSTANRKDADESDEDFPGYPHYPASDDIMNPSSEMERIPVDVEKLTPSDRLAGSIQPEITTSIGETFQKPGTEDDLRIVPGTEADVTKDDLRILNATDGAYGGGSLTGDDLDIPGAELDDVNEEIGEEDEENNYYSLGGDRHEDLEEDPS